MDLEAANQAKRFYASICPVCRELALEAFVKAQVAQFECGRCGGFGITAAARSTFGKRPEEERKEWLVRARQQVSNGQMAVVDAGNGSKA
jgi:Zn ribbon nucleic-acid-binding protein